MLKTKYIAIYSRNLIKKNATYPWGKQYVLKFGGVSIKIEREFSEKEAVEVLMDSPLDFEEISHKEEGV